MPSTKKLNELAVRAHAAATNGGDDLNEALAKRLDPRDERGDVAPRTVGIAVMAALAIAVGAIIRQKVTARANAINLN